MNQKIKIIKSRLLNENTYFNTNKEKSSSVASIKMFAEFFKVTDILSREHGYLHGFQGSWRYNV